jgi:hypothetical protein
LDFKEWTQELKKHFSKENVQARHGGSDQNHGSRPAHRKSLQDLISTKCLDMMVHVCNPSQEEAI